MESERAYELPPEVRSKLQDIAGERGEPIVVMVRVNHDLDTDNTTATAFASPAQGGQGSENGAQEAPEGDVSSWSRGLKRRDGATLNDDYEQSDIVEVRRGFGGVGQAVVGDRPSILGLLASGSGSQVIRPCSPPLEDIWGILAF